MSEHVAKALILFEQARYELAEQELRGALAEDPENAGAHALMGLCLANREKYAEATTEAQAAVQRAPDDPFCHYALGSILHDRNRFDEAARSAGEAIRLDPEDADYAALLSAIRIAQERWSEALREAERGLGIDAEHVRCANLRATALVMLGRRKEAERTLESALARDPENAQTHANQGWALLDQGDPKKALEHFREALRLEPDNDWARSGIVEALKARNPVYGLMLRYFLWMAKLSGRARWGVVLGGYVGYRIVLGAAERSPELAPFLWPVIALYIAFVVMTWIAVPLFNLLLRLNRFGRLALSREQIVASNWIGTCLLLALASLGWWLPTRSVFAEYSLLTFALLVLPLAGTFGVPSGWPRWVMGGLTAGLLGIRAAALAGLFVWAATSGGPKEPAFFGTAMAVFFLGVFASAILANALAGVHVKR